MNTTSRMEKLCNIHNIDFIISKPLLKRLKVNSKLIIKKIGKRLLKGKENSIELFAIS
jgi:hypothetical protein